MTKFTPKITQFTFSIKKDYYLFLIHIANKLPEEYVIKMPYVKEINLPI